MKNNINKDDNNMNLDEESKKIEYRKPTVKQIVFAVILILLAVVFCVLGFCVVGGAFDHQSQCNVASAYDATLADDGVVCDNFIFNSDFSINSSSSTSWVSRGKSVYTVDGWYLFNGDLFFTGSMPRLNFDSTLVGSVYSRLYSKPFSLLPGTIDISVSKAIQKDYQNNKEKYKEYLYRDVVNVDNNDNDTISIDVPQE